MEILGIGPSELLFIVVIALIVLGPRDMQKAGRMIGKWLRKVVTSDGWRLFQQTSREIQTLPNRLMREAALDELREVQNELRQPLDAGPRAAGQAGSDNMTPGPASNAQAGTLTDNKILPPAAPDEGTPRADDTEEKNA
jgi:sec-independent protein translocase protein TatB